MIELRICEDCNGTGILKCEDCDGNCCEPERCWNCKGQGWTEEE